MSDSERLQSHRTRKIGLTHRLVRLALDSGFQALALHRAAHFLQCLGLPFIPMLIRRLNTFFTGADIFPSARIGRNVIFIHSVGIVIGEKVVIEDDCDIYGQVVLGGRGGKTRGNDQPHIGNNSVICIGAKVLGKVNVGCGSTIAAGAVVLTSVPEHSLAAGVPATIKKRYDTCDA